MTVAELRPDTGDARSLPCVGCGRSTPDSMYCCGLLYCFNCLESHKHDVEDPEEAGYQRAIAALRDPQTLRYVSTEEECECGHGEYLHPKRGCCIDGLTWTKRATCPCRAYTPVLVVDDPFGFAEKYLRRAAEYLEAHGGSGG